MRRDIQFCRYRWTNERTSPNIQHSRTYSLNGMKSTWRTPLHIFEGYAYWPLLPFTKAHQLLHPTLYYSPRPSSSLCLSLPLSRVTLLGNYAAITYWGTIQSDDDKAKWEQKCTNGAPRNWTRQYGWKVSERGWNRDVGGTVITLIFDQILLNV